MLATVAVLALDGACDGEPCERVTVADGGEVRLSLCVARATTADERRRGLVGRDLDAGAGLLLVFPVQGEVCITNEDVGFDLDVLWLEASGAVTAIERAMPRDAAGPWCHAPATYVLEVHAGVAAETTIGDRVEL